MVVKNNFTLQDIEKNLHELKKQNVDLCKKFDTALNSIRLMEIRVNTSILNIKNRSKKPFNHGAKR